MVTKVETSGACVEEGQWGLGWKWWRMKEAGYLFMARAWDMVCSFCVLEVTDEGRACALV